MGITACTKALLSVQALASEQYWEISWHTSTFYSTYSCLQGPKWSDYVEPHPEVQAWMQRVAATVGSEWGKANKMLDLAVKRGKERLQQQQQPSKL